MDGDLDLIYTTSSPADGSGDRTVSIAENLGSSSFEITRPGASLSIDGQALLSESVLRIDALSGGLTVTGSLIVAPGASLIGDGEIFGSLSNEGTVEPDPLATFTVTGIYMQAVASGVGAENAILRLEISESSASSLSIGMSASLSGALIVEGPTSYDPPASASFPIVSAASTAGRFSVAFLPGVTPDIEGNGRFLRVDYPVAGVTNGTVSVNLVVDSLSGQIDTEAAEAFDVNGEPVAAAVGDLNNDGLIDLALAVPDPNAPTTAPGSAVVLYNAGSTAGVWNGFTNSTQITVGVDPSAIAFGEADLDGGLDIAVANSADDTVTVITNDGLGTPTSLVVAQVIFVGDDPQGVAFGDLDEDKWDDIAVANFGSDNVTILQNQQGIGPGWMGMGGAQTLPAGDGPIDVIFGDLDEDKWDDVVVLNANDGTVTFFDNAFPPGMFAPPLVLAADAGSLDLGIGDLDADGVNDIFTANPGADSVSIILNNGDSTFEPVVNLPLAGAPRSIAAVDLDDDLDLDLAIVAEDAMGVNTIRVLRNDLTDGQLIFAPDADIDAGSEPLFVFAGDVDNDGQGDLITVNSTSGARSAESGVPAMPIGVVRQSAAPCLGDCDGNGVVEFNDLVSMLFEFGNETAPVECDADASGVVEFNDLVTALFAFGPCN
ncbi:MAG: VCBS repeat-containing protein [Phycisphaerales bacterium]